MRPKREEYGSMKHKKMIYECYLFFEDEVVDKRLHYERYLSIALLLILLKQPFYLRNMAHLEQLLNLLKVIFDEVEREPSDQDDAGCKNFLEALQTARSDDEALIQKLRQNAIRNGKIKIEFIMLSLSLSCSKADLNGTEVTYATMLDIGNLMLAGCDPTYFWQSFNPPTDTKLPTQMSNQGSKLVARFSEVNKSRGRSMIILHTDQNLVLYTTDFSTDSANRYFESYRTRKLL